MDGVWKLSFCLFSSPLLFSLSSLFPISKSLQKKASQTALANRTWSPRSQIQFFASQTFLFLRERERESSRLGVRERGFLRERGRLRYDTDFCWFLLLSSRMMGIFLIGIGWGGWEEGWEWEWEWEGWWGWFWEKSLRLKIRNAIFFYSKRLLLLRERSRLESLRGCFWEIVLSSAEFAIENDDW